MDRFMTPVHGPSLWNTTPHFVKLQAEKSLDERGKSSSHLSGNCLLSTAEKFRWLQRDWKPMTLCDAGAILYQLGYEAKSRSFCSVSLQIKCNNLKEHLHDNSSHSSGGVYIILEVC